MADILKILLSHPLLLFFAILLTITIILFVFIFIKQGYEFYWSDKRYGFSKTSNNGAKPIEGRRLFQHKGYYPVDIEKGSNRPRLNSDKFEIAINYLLKEKYDKTAAMDLIYLREDNKFPHDPLKMKHEKLYNKLVKKYSLSDFRKNYHSETQELFRNYMQIVQDIGKTLRGVYFEILLHNVRNPLKSIIALSNSHEVSKRELYGPSTRFVVQYVKHQGKDLLEAFEAGSKVAYPKQFSTSKKVKATTTPLYHPRFGLIGILCFNIDMDAVSSLDDEGKEKFLSNYIDATGKTPKFEIDDAPDD